MKSKNKLMIISSFALAVVASLVMAFAFVGINNTPTTTVSAEGNAGLTIYFKNTFGSDPYIWAWEATDGTPNDSTDAWPGTKMTSDGDGWFYYTIKKANTNTLLFNDGNGNQTDDLTIDAETLYYNGNFWSSSKSVTTISATDDTFYLVGTHNGVTCWSISSNSIAMSDTTDTTYNYAQKDHVLLYKGDVLKAVNSTNSAWWVGCDTANGGFVSGTNNGDVTINSTGYYTVYVAKNGGTSGSERLWFANELQDLKTKVSTDKTHLLMISAFDLNNLANAATGYYQIGFNITYNGGDVSHYGTTYYTTVTVNNGTETPTEVTASSLYSKADYKLIVHEIDCVAGKTVTIQAFIRYSSDGISYNNIAFSDIISDKTIQ